MSHPSPSLRGAVPVPVRAVLATLESQGLPLMSEAELGGGSNLTWRCDSPAGPVAVKVYTGTWDDPATAVAHEAASLAAWSGTGAVPDLVTSGTVPRPYLVTGYVRGAPATAADTAAVLADVARLHAAPLPVPHPWPRLLAGRLGQTPDRLRNRDHPAAAVLAADCLAVLADEPEVLIHGDVAPWNVLVRAPRPGHDPAAGAVVLLDPLAKRGPAVFDHARWCVTATLTQHWASGANRARPEPLLEELAAAVARTAGSLARPAALACAVALELLNRASFPDPRWPAGYEPVLLRAAQLLAPGP